MKRRNFQSLLVAGQLVAQLVHALSADNNLVPLHLWLRKTRPKLENVSMFCPRLWHYFVDNKVKGRISKQVLRENKLRQIYRKTNISYPLISTLACAYQGLRNIFRKFGVLCFSCNTRFEVRTFALLPTISGHIKVNF